ncbi:hypothetical protein [Neisseria elongata]|nr:hypothetical protein [Neisseria elongata]
MTQQFKFGDRVRCKQTGAGNLQSLNGITSEEHRAATGGVMHKLK